MNNAAEIIFTTRFWATFGQISMLVIITMFIGYILCLLADAYEARRERKARIRKAEIKRRYQEMKANQERNMEVLQEAQSYFKE